MGSPDTAPQGLTTDVAGLAAESAGTELGCTGWRRLKQEEINRFADLTDDHNPIHVDPGFAAKSPFGKTIVHGFFTLSLLAPLINELLRVEGASVSVNYGLDRVRFPAPLLVGAEFRAAVRLAEVKPLEGGVQVKVGATLEVRGEDKPAVVAECLFRHYS